jgi:uncharacterized membrane protein YhaH (DUF805 family)
MDSFNPQAIVQLFQDTITNHYFDMKGRVRRQTFWYFVLACIVVQVAAAIIDGILRTVLVGAIVGLALLLPLAGMGARRLQDIGRNGALVWALVIPSAITQVFSLLFWLSGGPFGAVGFLSFYLTIGWLISVISLIALIALIYFWVQPGTVGPNEYGPDPKTSPAAA